MSLIAIPSLILLVIVIFIVILIVVALIIGGVVKKSVDENEPVDFKKPLPKPNEDVDKE